MNLIILGILGAVGAVFAFGLKSAGTVQNPDPTSGTPTGTPANGTTVPPPVTPPNQTGLSDVNLNDATDAINKPGNKKDKKKHKK